MAAQGHSFEVMYWCYRKNGAGEGRGKKGEDENGD